MNAMTGLRGLAIAATTLLAAPAAFAQDSQPPAAAASAPDVTELAKQTQNPVGDVITVPFQFNFNTGGGLSDETFLNLNFQPVIPFTVNDNWNAIARTIVPINSAPAANGQRESGIGDIQEQVFFTPSHVGKIIWGVGPVFSFPTATSSAFKSGTWAAGAGIVVLAMPGPWVVGAVLNQFWPIADRGGDPETNLMTLQVFANYNFGKSGWALAYAPIITANWNAAAGNRWTVPVGLGLTRTAVFNHRPMNIGVQYYSNVAKPDGSAGESLRFVVALIYPQE